MFDDNLSIELTMASQYIVYDPSQIRLKYLLMVKM